MKKQKEERLLELLETKAYNALNEEERQLVDAEMSQDEYDFQRRILLEASEMDQNVVPRPLVFNRKTRILPFVWTASISAAAAVLIMFLVMPKESIELNFAIKEASSAVAADTVYVENRITDTIVNTIIQKEYVVRNVSDASCDVQLDAYSGSQSVVPNIPTSEIANQGRSAKEDATLMQFSPEPFIGM